MNREELKAVVAQLLQDMDAPVHTASNEDLADITTMDLRKLYAVDHPADRDGFMALKLKTPARLGVGKAGCRYPTLSMLRFRADHAAAQDSVFSMVEPDFAQKHNLTFVRTKCEDKEIYLTGPDLGRRFDEKNQEIIRKTCGNHPKIVLVVGDGLSSISTQTNAIPCRDAMIPALKAKGFDVSASLYVEFCRVGASDHIGELTDCDLVCMLVGERPGLASAESLSAYITYRPRIGTPESHRTVVSNIHKHGIPAQEAGRQIAELIPQMLERKCSGVPFRQGGVNHG